MTALSITAANVAWVSGPVDKDCVAGEAFAAGALVYLSAAGTWLKAQCDGTAAEAGQYGLGMALATADAAGARVSIARPGAIVTVAASGLTIGVPYFVGATAGTMAPYADLSSGNAVVPCAVSRSATQLQLGYLYDSGAVHA
jgi:hypothetical protein